MRRFNHHAKRGRDARALRWVERACRLAPQELLPVEARGYLRLRLGQKLAGIADLKIVAGQTSYEGSRLAVERLAGILRDEELPDEADRFLRMNGVSQRDVSDAAFA